MILQELSKDVRLPASILIKGSIATLAAVLAPAAALAQSSEYSSRIDSVFAEYDNTRSPGCAVGVIYDGRFVFRRGYGMANLEHGIPLSSSSVFRIGSTSKQFTAASILLLEQEGKLSLDDDIRKYLPELPDYGVPLTIRHLIHHTSGVRDYLTLMTLAGKRDDDFYTDEDVVDILGRQEELNFAPGDEFLYSNSGYFLLSQIVKKASGMTLREYAHAKIFQPLGMASTHFHDDHDEIVLQRAAGYAPTDEGGFRISMTTLDMVGDGGVFTTVGDLFHWGQNFYDPTVGGQRLLEGLHRRGILMNGDTLSYAAGLVRSEYRGLNVVRHGGAFVGFRAEMVRFPAERLTIICLCNVNTARPSALADRIADIFLEDQLEPRMGDGPGSEQRQTDEEETSIELTPGQLEAYAGDYYSRELDATYRLYVEADSLKLSVGNFLDGSLVPMEPDIFRARRLTLRFQSGAGNRGFLLDAGRVKSLRFERVTE